MKGKNALKFFLVILATALLTYIAFKGFSIPGSQFSLSGADKTRFGIDIKGGVRVVLSAPAGIQPTDQEMASVVKVLENRLDTKQILDRSIIPEKAMGRVIVEIPWKAEEKEFNAQKAADELGKTALLQFYELTTNTSGQPIKVGNPILTGKDVKSASVDPTARGNGGNIVVALKFNPTGQKLFEEATGRLIGKQIGIYLDEELMSAPNVREKIVGGDGVIEMGGGDAKTQMKEANDLAAVINAGALPFKLEQKEIKSISPILGKNALDVSLKAGLVSLILVWIFMLIYYRLPGILANIALLLHTVIQVLFITWTGITLTLPGIAGIILTIGMGVDANVIIFERIKEELRNGKTLRTGIEVGFKRAFSAILDANITTAISGAVLYIFGSGAIKSFAITLLLGVFLSFFTAITASRVLLKSVSDLDVAKHRWLYGVGGRRKTADV